MRYLCLMYTNGGVAPVPAADAVGPGIDPAGDTRSLLVSGRLLACGALSYEPFTTTIEPASGDLRVEEAATPRPRPAAFLLISARDLNEAIRIASRVGSGGPWRGARMELLPIRDAQD